MNEKLARHEAWASTREPNPRDRTMMAFLKRLVGARVLPAELSYEDARAVLESRERAAQRELAARADAEPEMLYYLAWNGDQTTRRAVAANPATPAKAERILADDVDPSVRSELARKIGRLPRATPSASSPGRIILAAR